MIHREKVNPVDAQSASLIMRPSLEEIIGITGMFHLEHIRDGKVIYEEDFKNTVTTVGKNLLLDTLLAGSAYTVTGPFMGLISSVSYSAIAAADTMASHAGWTEAGSTNAPTYTSPRKTMNSWNAAAAGSKATNTAPSFAITGTGTVKGAFVVLGTGATSTIENTGGVLYSAGLFSGGDRAVQNGDTLNVSYTASA